MHRVKPKKSLGQHFLADERIAERIAGSLTGHGGYHTVVEIGPGTGALTRFLAARYADLHVVELDRESAAYLRSHYPTLKGRILEADVLAMDLDKAIPGPFGLIGNFPYNISSQILFRAFEHRDRIPEVVGMFQKEVAERIAAPPGSRTYGILSVLLQAFYDIEYLFTVEPGAFVPPPKVRSGVIRLRRNATAKLDCNEQLFLTLVKTAFNQRRKMLRNPLRHLLPPDFDDAGLLSRRAENLTWQDYVRLARAAEAFREGNA